MSTTIEHPNHRAHADDTFAARFGAPDFRVYPSHHDDPRDPYLHCSYCGSLTVADALRFLQTPGTAWSASDWKYGWPHKFYVEVPCEPHLFPASYRIENGQKVDVQYSTRSKHHLKFYTTHLKDATPAQLEQWNTHIAPIVGVRFEQDGEQLRWFAERGAWKRHGVIG